MEKIIGKGEGTMSKTQYSFWLILSMLCISALILAGCTPQAETSQSTADKEETASAIPDTVMTASTLPAIDDGIDEALAELDALGD